MKSKVIIPIFVISVLFSNCKKDAINSTPGYGSPSGTSNGRVPTLLYNYEGSGKPFFGQAIFDTLMKNEDTIIGFSNLTPDSIANFYFGIYSHGQQSFSSKKADGLGNIYLIKSDFNVPNEDGDSLTIRIGTSYYNLAIYKRYEIRSWQDLQAMRVDLTGNYNLMNDVSISFTNKIITTSGFDPIGGRISIINGLPDIKSFTGSFFGNRYSINNFFIQRQNSLCGLFGSAKGALINDLTINQIGVIRGGYVDNATIGVNPSFGTLAGICTNCEIKNVKVVGNGVQYDSSLTYPTSIYSINVGGLLGTSVGCSISSCFANINFVFARTIVSNISINAGGLVGGEGASILTNNQIGSNLKSCFSSGFTQVISPFNGNMTAVGGLVGSLNLGSIINCHSADTLEGSGYLGGLVGLLSNSNISTSFFDGMVVGDDYMIGGSFLGSLSTGVTNSVQTSITNCYSTGTIQFNIRSIQPFNSIISGFIGECSGDFNLYARVTNCYTTGVPSYMYKGVLQYGNAFMGPYNSLIATNNYYQFNSSVYDQVASALDIATASQTAFIGFDFVNTWRWTPGHWPTFVWQ